MTLSEARTRHAQLVEEIRQHDHAYYVQAKPTITDQEYDKLYQELIELEEANPDLATPDSPSQRVGGQPVDGFTRVKHVLPMLSLEKIRASKHPDEKEEPDVERRKRHQDEKTLEELKAFDATLQKQLGKRLIEYVVEPKVDGVSIGVHYKEGKLVLGVTRGDGTTGDDITSNIRTIRGIPLELRLKDPPAFLEVRGEAYISKADFDKLNAKMESSGEDTFPNARNATAGTLKQLDPRSAAQRPLNAVFYAVGVCEGIKFSTHAEVLESLKKFGLRSPALWWLGRGIDEVIAWYKKEIVCDYDEQHDLRSKLPYEIDGIVLKVNDLSDWKRIPAKAKAPGYAIVHKPIPWITPAETLVKSITVQVGRTGVLTPVAELAPVFVQGSTISRATLHNEGEIDRKGIRIGDTVVIRKAGMVIPEVVEVVKSKRPSGTKKFDLYEYVGGKCPACSGPIARERVSAGNKKEAAWRCQNIAGCPAQKMRRIEYFAQRKALDIESLGGIVAQKLIETGLVEEPLDLFNLAPDKLARLNLGTEEEPRIFGEKNATKLLDAVQRARMLPLARWLLALAIPDTGEETAYDLANYFPDLPTLVSSPLLKDTAHLGDLRRAFHENKVGKNDKGSIPVGEQKERKKRQQEARLQAGPIGRRLLDAGFAKPATGSHGSDWQAVTMIGPVAAKALVDWFGSDVGRRVLERMSQLGLSPAGGNRPRPDVAQQDVRPLFEKRFVLTGTLSGLSRDQAAEKIRSLGGDVSNSVSKNTTFLVVGENPGAAKTDQARALGVQQLTEDQFLAMVGSGGQPKSQKQEELF